MNRRGFLGSILALGAAPAIVRADSLMRVIPRETTLAVWHPNIFTFSTQELTMAEDDFARRIIAPAAAKLAQMIDEECFRFVADGGRISDAIYIRSPRG